MTRYTYPAIITFYPENGNYVAEFPDFPGAMLFSTSIEKLLGGIGDTLQYQIEADIGRGKPIPEPTPFEQHLHQDENCISWWTIAHCDVNDLTVESMNEVLSRYRLDIGWDDMTVEEKSAFHANRPMTSGLMNPVGAEPIDHDAYEECLADSKGDDQ